MLYVSFFIKNFSEFFKDFFIILQIFLMDTKFPREKRRRDMKNGEINFTRRSIKRLKKQRMGEFAKKAWCRPSPARAERAPCMFDKFITN